MTSEGHTLDFKLFSKEMRWLLARKSFCQGIDRDCLVAPRATQGVHVLDYPEPRVQSLHCSVLLETPEERCSHCRYRVACLQRDRPEASPPLPPPPPPAEASDRGTPCSLSPAEITTKEEPLLVIKTETLTDGHAASSSSATMSEDTGLECPVSGSSTDYEHVLPGAVSGSDAASGEPPTEERGNPPPCKKPRRTPSDEAAEIDNDLAEEEEEEGELKDCDQDVLPLEVSCDAVYMDVDEPEEAETPPGSCWQQQQQRDWSHPHPHPPQSPVPPCPEPPCAARAHSSSVSHPVVRGENSHPLSPSTVPDGVPPPVPSAPTPVPPSVPVVSPAVSPPVPTPAPVPADKMSCFRPLHPDHPDIVSLRSGWSGALSQVGILAYKSPEHLTLRGTCKKPPAAAAAAVPAKARESRPHQYKLRSPKKRRQIYE